MFVKVMVTWHRRVFDVNTTNPTIDEVVGTMEEITEEMMIEPKELVNIKHTFTY